MGKNYKQNHIENVIDPNQLIICWTEIRPMHVRLSTDQITWAPQLD